METPRHGDAPAEPAPVQSAPSARRIRPPHGVVVGVRAAFALLSLVIVIGSGIAWATFQNFEADIPHGSPVPPLAAGQKDPDGSAQNILLIGNDPRVGATRAELKALHTGHDKSTANADTMMVLHVPSGG